MNGQAKETPMTNDPYILFNQSPEQLRRIGARGGRARGRKRARRHATEQTAAPRSGEAMNKTNCKFRKLPRE
jgi:hypothetical protein